MHSNDCDDEIKQWVEFILLRVVELTLGLSILACNVRIEIQSTLDKL